MKRTDRRMGLCIALLILILAFIWGNSLLPGEISGRISQWVKHMLFPNMGDNQDLGHGLLRKLAHFTEFFCLGMCLLWLCSMLEKKIVWPLSFSALAACMDEAIQLFVPDRGPALLDVAIDTVGAALGIGVLLLGYTIGKQKMKQ